MKTTLNAFLMAVLALVVLRGVGRQLGPAPAEIQATDSGTVAREKYLAIYRAGMRQAASDFAVRVESGEFAPDDSLALVSAWAEAMRAAGKAASVGVDRRMTLLAKDDPQAWAAWARAFSEP